VARVAEVEENGTEAGEMPIRDPLIITINKSEVYALYDLTYLRVNPLLPNLLDSGF
jgi:hypothetical protein